MPFFGFETWLTSETFPYIVLICIFSIVYYFLGNAGTWRRIQSLKFGSSGFEIKLSDIHKVLLAEEQESQPEELKAELSEIRQISGNPLETLLIIDNKLEEKIKLLVSANNLNYRGFLRSMRALGKLNYIDSTVYSLLLDFRPLRNQIVHNYERLSEDIIETAIALGELLLSRLTIIYVQDVPIDKGGLFIRNSEANNPKLEYILGRSKSGEPGFTGIYYMIRESIDVPIDENG